MEMMDKTEVKNATIQFPPPSLLFSVCHHCKTPQSVLLANVPQAAVFTSLSILKLVRSIS